MSKIPLLLDTDPGSDIDDAVAIAYLLAQPRCELLGITVVTGEVEKRAAVADVICNAAGRDDIPIHLGRRTPLLHGPGQPQVPHYEAVQDLPHRLDRPENTAVDFLRETIRDRPGEITLLTIGPYSNVGLLFALDPEIPSLLKGLVSMGGVFFAEGRREWNALVDPTATALTYGAKRRDHLSIGLDATEQCTMTPDEVQEKFQGGTLGVVRRMAEKWFEKSEKLTFHDPLAAALIFEPDLAATRFGRVHVSREDGTTTFIEGDGPDRVADQVQVADFFDHFVGTCTRLR